MTPTEYEFDIDVTVIDDDFADCIGPGIESCLVVRPTKQTTLMEPVQLEQLVLACRQ
jgi:hypothetical protein